MASFAGIIPIIDSNTKNKLNYCLGIRYKVFLKFCADCGTNLLAPGFEVIYNILLNTKNGICLRSQAMMAHRFVM